MKIFEIHSLSLSLEWLSWSSGSVWVCSWASEPKYLIYFGLPTSDKYNLDKINAYCMWRNLERVQTGLGSLGKSIWFKSKIEAHEDDKCSRTSVQENDYKW